MTKLRVNRRHPSSIGTANNTVRSQGDSTAKVRLPTNLLEILQLQAEASRSSLSDVIRAAISRSLTGVDALSLVNSFRGNVNIFLSAKPFAHPQTRSVSGASVAVLPEVDSEAPAGNDFDDVYMADLVSLEAISSTLDRSAQTKRHLHLGTKATVQQTELFNSNVICIGGPRTNLVTKEFLIALSNFYENCSFKFNDKELTVVHTGVTIRADRSASSVHDGSVLVWGRNPFHTDYFVLIVAGLHSLGTHFAVGKATNEFLGSPGRAIAAAWDISVAGAEIQEKPVGTWVLQARAGSAGTAYDCFDVASGYIQIIVPFARKGPSPRHKYQVKAYISATTMATVFFSRLHPTAIRKYRDKSPFFLGDELHLASNPQDHSVVIGSPYNNDSAAEVATLLKQRYGDSLPAEIVPLDDKGRPLYARILDDRDEARGLLIRRGARQTEEQVFATPSSLPEKTEFDDYGVFVKEIVDGRTIWFFQGTHAPGCQAILLALTEYSEHYFPLISRHVNVKKPFVCAIKATIILENPVSIDLLGAWQLPTDVHHSKERAKRDGRPTTPS